MQYFEDIEIGAVRELGSHTFTQDAIIAFAKNASTASWPRGC